MNTHIDRLTTTAKEFLNKPIKMRIQKCREQVWIPYPQALNILNELEELYEYPKKDRMPNLLIVGSTNNGKTTILNKFMQMHPMYIDVYNVIPIIKISAPISPSQNALYEKILDELLVPYGTTESTSRKEYQVKKILGDIKTKILIIDEFQDIFHGRISFQREFLTALKHLSTSLQIPIVVAGVWEVQSVLTSDKQIDNRFETLRLDNWKFDKDFARLLMSFESTLPLREASNLHSKVLATKLFEMCEGMIGELARIVEKSAVFALKNNQEKIDIDTLNSINYLPPSLRRN
ncbi:TniB family NTP-binding protein [Sulfurimonas sp.]